MDLFVSFLIPKQTSRRIQAGEAVSWEAELSLCVCFLPTLQLIFNRTRAESFTLLLHSLAILIHHISLSTFPPTLFALAHFLWLLLPFHGGHVSGGSIVKSRWVFISLPLSTWDAPSRCAQCLQKDWTLKSLTAECDYCTFRFISWKDDRDELPAWD